MLNINATDPLAMAVKKAIHEGDLDGLKRLMAENKDLAQASIA